MGETAAALPVTVWAPDGCTDRDALPLLAVHDGPEYDRYAAITRFSAAQTAAGVLPAHRVALVHPVERDAWYSGSPQYLRTLVQAGLGRITWAYETAGPLVVMGASLGGLTALLAGLLGPRRSGVSSPSPGRSSRCATTTSRASGTSVASPAPWERSSTHGTPNTRCGSR